MSPTSYQTAPPRSSIINNVPDLVKLAASRTIIFQSRRRLITVICAWLRIHRAIHGIEEELRFDRSLVLETGIKEKSAARRPSMAKKDVNAKAPSSERGRVSAQPRLHQRAAEIQAYGTVSHQLPLDLEEPVRLEMTEQLNLMLADTMTLRDLYKKSHWQVAGPTFYQLHLLFDKHFEEQVKIVDEIAERIQLLGGISLAMAADVAETTRIERPPRGREEVPVQISRLVDAHQIIIGHCRELAELSTKLGDAGTNDRVVSSVLRPNELQAWFLTEHLVEVPLVHAEEQNSRKAG